MTYEEISTGSSYKLRVNKLIPHMLCDQSTLPVNVRSSWHRAKSQILTEVSSEQEQNFKSVLQKLLKKIKVEGLVKTCP